MGKALHERKAKEIRGQGKVPLLLLMIDGPDIWSRHHRGAAADPALACR